MYEDFKFLTVTLLQPQPIARAVVRDQCRAGWNSVECVIDVARGNMMASSRLPPEMIQEIIDYLHDDIPTLKACSLVSKAWTHPARILLFSRLTLIWPLNLQSAIFPFVRHLRIFMPHMNLLRLIDLMDRAPAWDKIFPLLTSFRHIASLSIRSSRHSLTGMTPLIWSKLASDLSTVVSLSLSEFSFTNTSFFTQVICAFPCLRELSMRLVFLSKSTEGFESELPPVTTSRLPSNLETVKLDTENSRSGCSRSQPVPLFATFACKKFRMKISLHFINSWEHSEIRSPAMGCTNQST